MDHYEITRLIGRGGMGEVYLARDTALGRRVALKMVHPRFVGSGRAITRFLMEAQATARFSHPNIVAIYGVGQHRGAPYVALEFVQGQTLLERMEERLLSLGESLRIGLQIAEALAEAHAHGIVHRDLKPENVLIAPDGRIRVLDFGLALFVGRPSPGKPHGSQPSAASSPSPQAVAGTPGYMAPEQWLGLALQSSADIWALGVLLFELCTGRPPFEARSVGELKHRVTGDEPPPSAASISDVPEELAELIGRCLEREPDARPGAAQVARVLGDMLHPGRRQLGEEQCPFRGLLPFAQRHADFFFGREPQIAALVERARVHTVLPVVGPSGVGKSSFVQAGFIPRLREQSRWTAVRLRPGATPFRTLAARLVRADSRISGRSLASIETAEADASWVEAVDELAERLYESPKLLALELEQRAEQGACNVLLFVDQLEELFTHGHDGETCRRFIEALCSSADDPDGPVRTVFAVRGDFLDRVSLGPEARDALTHVTVLQRPGPHELRETLIKPLEIVGYAFDDLQLPDEMVAAVGDEPGCLPLLQFVARQLWESRDADRRLLLRTAYDALGGVEGALARHADGVLAGLSTAEQRVARQLLLRMITPERTRRVIGSQEALDGLGARGAGVLAHLAAARLVTVSTASAAQPGSATTDDGSFLELAHESLIHSWSRLKAWLDESRDDLAFIAEVAPAAELWQKRGRSAEGLWQGDELREALRKLERSLTEVPAVIREFLAAALRRERSRTARRRFAVGAALALLSALALVLFIQNRTAEQARDRAEAARFVAERRHAESLREGARAAFGRRAMLEARAKLRLALEGGDDPSVRALWWQVRRDPLLWKRDVGAGVYDVAVSPDGSAIAAACLNGAVYLFDRHTATARIFRGQTDQTSSVAISPDGRVIASGHLDGTVAFWSPEQARPIRTVAGKAGSAQSLHFHPNGKLLATGGMAVRFIDVGTGKTEHTLDLGAEVASVRFRPDGAELAATTIDGNIVFVDTQTGQIRRTVESQLNGIRGASFSPDGRLLAVGGQDHRVRLFRVAGWTPVHTLTGHRGQVWNVAFSPDGTLLATAGFDHTVRLWDVASGAEHGLLEAHDAEVYAVQFSPDGKLLVSGGFDDTVRAWDVSAIQPSRRQVGHGAAVYRVAFTRDGQRLASGGLDSTARIWDVKTGAQLLVLPHPGGVLGLSFSPDGRRLACASASQVHLWDVATGEPLLQLLRHQGSVWDVSFSPDGQRLASSSSDATVRVWDGTTGEHLHVLRGHEGAVYRTNFSPDGSRIASASRDGTARVWDVATGHERAVIDDLGGRVYGAAFDPTSQKLATATRTGTVRLHDLAQGGHRVVRQQAARAYDIAFDPTGTTVGVPLSDRSGRLWHLSDGAEIVLSGHRSEVNSLRFSPDGALVATAGDDGTVRTWQAKTGRPAWRGVALLTKPVRLLSHRGWELLSASRSQATDWKAPEARDWLRRVEQHAAYAVVQPPWVCIQTFAGAVELWHTAEDVRKAATESTYEETYAAPFGCVARRADGVSVVTAAGEQRLVAESPTTACAVDDNRILVASGDELITFDAEHRQEARRRVDPGAVAVARIGDALVLGYSEGNVELVPADDAAAQEFGSIRLERVPSSPPVRFVAGPMDTLLVGFTNGLVGMWNREDGKLLMSARIHGRVVHLTIEAQTLFAATDLGSYLTWDLRVLHQHRCALLREVWSRIPVVWEDGLAVARSAPEDHPCHTP